MITDQPLPARRRRLWPRLVLALPLVAAGWLAVLALVLRFGGPAPAALVVLPSDAFLAHLPEGAAITAAGPYGLVLKSDRPGFVADLYAAGALLVLPAGLAACLPFPDQAFGS